MGDTKLRAAESAFCPPPNDPWGKMKAPPAGTCSRGGGGGVGKWRLTHKSGEKTGRKRRWGKGWQDVDVLERQMLCSGWESENETGKWPHEEKEEKKG